MESIVYLPIILFLVIVILYGLFFLLEVIDIRNEKNPKYNK